MGRGLDELADTNVCMIFFVINQNDKMYSYIRHGYAAVIFHRHKLDSVMDWVVYIEWAKLPWFVKKQVPKWTMKFTAETFLRIGFSLVSNTTLVTDHTYFDKTTPSHRALSEVRGWKEIWIQQLYKIFPVITWTND